MEVHERSSHYRWLDEDSEYCEALELAKRDRLAIADRPPDQTGSSGWTTTSGSLDGPLTQLYIGRAV